MSGIQHNKYINERPQKVLWAGPSLLRSSAHYVGVEAVEKLQIC